jgi:hypothetical protein
MEVPEDGAVVSNTIVQKNDDLISETHIVNNKYSENF